MTVTVTSSGGAVGTPPDELIARILSMGGDDLVFFLPLYETDPADNAPVQDLGPRGLHFQCMANIALAADPYVQGNVLAYRFDGSAEAIDAADNDLFSMGADGTAPNEPAFTLAIAVKFNDATNDTLIARYDLTTGATALEYSLRTQAADLLVFNVYDDSTGARIGRYYNSATAEGVWLIIIATYDGSQANSGFRIYVDGVRVDDTNDSAGAYTAMENTAVVTSIGYSESAGGALVNYLDGDAWGPLCIKRAISAVEVWELYGVYRRCLGL